MEGTIEMKEKKPKKCWTINTIDQCDQSHKVGCHQGQIETSPNQSYHIGK
jgi:hypothetical protein